VDLEALSTERSRDYRISWWRFTWDLEIHTNIFCVCSIPVHESELDRPIRQHVSIADLTVVGVL